MNKLDADTRTEYASLLTKLVEMNEDKKWLEDFYNLRRGKDLPGGGMGSLNDWSPTYSDYREYAWFNLLYRITHWLLTEKKEPDLLIENFSIKHRNEASVLICNNCSQKFQHPRIFEHQIANFYYLKNFSEYVDQKRLINLTDSNSSYNSNEAIVMRESLESDYRKKEIILFDFQKSKSVCPNCDTNMEVGHINYEILEREGKLELIGKKPVANNI